LKTIFVVASMAILAACGGGCGEANAMPTSSQYPLQTAMRRIANDSTSFSVSMSGTVPNGSVTATGTFTQSPLVPAVFETVSGLSKTETLSTIWTIAGTAQPPSTTVDRFFYDKQFNPLGHTTNGTYDVVTVAYPIPVTASIGDSGLIFQQTSFSSSAKTTLEGSKTMSYVIDGDASAGVKLRLIQTQTFPPSTGIQPLTKTRTYSVSQSGNINLLTEQVLWVLENQTVDYSYTFK
jgi:hypothetical protein